MPRYSEYLMQAWLLPVGMLLTCAPGTLFLITGWRKAPYSISDSLLISTTHCIFKWTCRCYFVFYFSLFIYVSSFSEKILVFFFILKFPPDWATVATEGPLWTSVNGTFCWKQKKSFCQLLLFLPCFLMLSWWELSWFSMEFKRRLSLPSFFINGYVRHSLCM